MALRPAELTDPRAMRALAHPVRLSLIEALANAGRPLTATETAELVGESPSSCSFHLRQLAKYGFVEEAEGARGRRRPWKLTRVGLSFSVDAPADSEAELAAGALERVLRDRFLTRASAALDTRPALPPEWRRVTGMDQYLIHGTPEELERIREEMLDLLLRYHDRLLDPSKRPEGSRPVEVLALTYPVDLPG